MARTKWLHMPFLTQNNTFTLTTTTCPGHRHEDNDIIFFIFLRDNNRIKFLFFPSSSALLFCRLWWIILTFSSYSWGDNQDEAFCRRNIMIMPLALLFVSKSEMHACSISTTFIHSLSLRSNFLKVVGL